jgi:hypothetical protein
MNNKSAKGGKGKGLIWLEENKDIGYNVPKFDIIDSSYHEDVLKQGALAKIIGGLQTKVTGQPYIGKITGNVKRLEDKCAYLANQFNGEDVMVRSSALISEDNDKFSGAGIYDSFEVSARYLSKQSLLNAVFKVYSSADNERAVQYRKSNGLGDERMEVIVQKLERGHNGVAMSRLQARNGIIPVSWSELRGAVVGSANVEDMGEVYTAFFSPLNNKRYIKGAHKLIFQSEDAKFSHTDYIENNLLPLMDKIKGRYGKEFEFEFVINLPERFIYKDNKDKPIINLVQIRPLTNIQDKEVVFPKKKSIMEAEYCMGVGEYIGKWVIPQSVNEGWNEPKHYAYVSPCLDKTMPGVLGGLGSLFGFGESKGRDYDKLTPNKKAMVITSQRAIPSMHALNIANEKGIICLAGNTNKKIREEKIKEEKRSKSEEPELAKLELHNRAWARQFLGEAFVDPIEFNIPVSEVGPYIHIVSDGLKGRVYKATEKEARDFEKNYLKT